MIADILRGQIEERKKMKGNIQNGHQQYIRDDERMNFLRDCL
jgi:hypothetical protein